MKKRNASPIDNPTSSRGNGGTRMSHLVLPQDWTEDLKKAVEVMAGGGVILYPTDTIWGLGCDAGNAEAVARLFAIKQRADAKAMISLVDNEALVQFYVQDVPEVAWDLMELAQRPLTIVYDHARHLAPNLLAPDGSAALRLTREPFSRELCRRMRGAVVSTSANVSGHPAPRCFADIRPEFLKAVDYVCTSRREETENPPASSVIRLGDGGQIEIIRE